MSAELTPEARREVEKTGALVYTLFSECVETVVDSCGYEYARICAVGGIVGGLRVILDELESDMNNDDVRHLRDQIICRLYPPSSKAQN